MGDAFFCFFVPKKQAKKYHFLFKERRKA